MKRIYFRPQYVGEFVCDSSKCNDVCCERAWNIDADEATYKKYLQLAPDVAAQFKYNEFKKKYLLTKRPCPFLTDKKLCRLQLEYGENFLSMTCKTYPRVTFDFVSVFEQSLTLTCPVAAEMILFQSEPMKFELVEVEENSKGILINGVHLAPKILAHVPEIQIAMISILQERTLTIDQRLIVLAFFLDRLDEILSAKTFDSAALVKLISAYESKNFLAEQVPRMIRSIAFDAKKFAALISDLLIDFHGEGKFADNIKKIAANYNLLGDFRKNFLGKHSAFLENYLVNELFMNCYPWRFGGDLMKNFGVFAIKYKIFELTLLLRAMKNSVDKAELISLTNWFCTQFDHVEIYQQRIFDYLADKDDVLDLPDSLFEGSDLNDNAGTLGADK